jgi:hypothetical protein
LVTLDRGDGLGAVDAGDLSIEEPLAFEFGLRALDEFIGKRSDGKRETEDGDNNFQFHEQLSRFDVRALFEFKARP